MNRASTAARSLPARETEESRAEGSAGGLALDRAGRVLLAADLHLAGGPEPRERLRRLLALSRAEDASLYLLGDVFHYWLGRRHLARPEVRREVEILRGASAVGPPIAIVPGNRDYLLDDSFTRATGVRIAPAAIAVACAGLRLHLSHGDLFGLADVRYLRMRRALRSAPVRFLARSLPTPVIAAIAGGLRRHSERVVPRKSAETLAPDRAAVAAILAGGFDAVVCGHFHDRREERLPAAEGGGLFRVLEPFEVRGYALSLGPEGWREHFVAAAKSVPS